MSPHSLGSWGWCLGGAVGLVDKMGACEGSKGLEDAD